MNNLENLKDYVNENIENIKITEDIRSNIIKRSGKNTSNKLMYTAMIVTPILLISCLFFNDQISYATQRGLRYLPGVSKLFYTDIEHQAYGLSGSIEMPIGEKYIKVNSSYSEGNTVTIIIEGNIPFDQLIVMDEYKKAAESMSWDIIGDADFEQWSGRMTCTFTDSIKRFYLVYDKYEIPIIMTELPEVFSKDRNYVSVEGIGIDIAVLTNYVEDKLEVNLLAQTNNPAKTISFPLSDIYLLNDKGEKYYATNSNLENILYFDRKLEPGIRLVIPYISITDESLQSKVTISKDDEAPINITVGDNVLVINSLEWIQYVERFNFRTPQNDYHLVEEVAQKVKLNFNKSLVGTNELKLHNILADVDENQLNKYIVEGVNVIYSDPSEENNSEMANDKELILSNIKEDQQEIDITFTRPVFYTSKEVIIPLQP
ncbi:hypothetical protein Amet_0107 [Alkaliphilus metalliredigens QYMF]|uniref:DUF4179 domain-containing protein n=1 Tax=Alkaliphilus metalliredigens (strain QYMF) TaxID=293826 RepID=A6TJI1_ALKMQ|nr:hypothetical protein [Alkaliphilus metalliredigens]ABR46349.1 hypothetical protein Amet_0107 [Alkaliphilus metalliredigens QYMF]